MGAENKYLDKRIPRFYRREIFHVMIFTFIDCRLNDFPSNTIQEAADAFMKRYKIFEEEYSTDTVVAIYGRVNKDLIDAERFQNKQKEASKA